MYAQLIIEPHAHKRYCQRVADISLDDLQDLVSSQQQVYRKRSYVQMDDGVWWRYSYRDQVLTLHTCYGKHDIDLPAAIAWAKMYKDRIALGGVADGDEAEATV